MQIIWKYVPEDMTAAAAKWIYIIYLKKKKKNKKKWKYRKKKTYPVYFKDGRVKERCTKNRPGKSGSNNASQPTIV